MSVRRIGRFFCTVMLMLIASLAFSADAPKSGIERVKELYNQSEISRNASPHEAIKQGQTALTILDGLENNRANLEWRALLLTNIAWAEGILSHHDRAFIIAKNALELAKDSGSGKAVARCRNTIAILNREIGNFDVAFSELNEVLNIEIAEGNTNRIITTQNNLGLLLGDMGRPNDALGIFLEALSQAKQDTDPLTLIRVRINMTTTLITLGDFEQAEKTLTRILQENPNLPINQKAVATQNLGRAHLGLKNLTKAEALLTDALVYWSTVDDAADLVSTRLDLAKVKLQKGESEAAERLLIEAEQFARTGKRLPILRNVLLELSLFYESFDLQKSLAYARDESELSKQIFSDNLGKRVGQFQSRIAQAEREKELDALKRENELKAAQVEQQKYYIYLTGAAGLFALLLLGLLVYRLRVRRQMHETRTAARERALAQISHEFRTPLTGIIGVSELLQSTNLTPEQRELMRTVHYSSESLLGLVNDLLDISQLDVGKLVLQSKNFDLRELIESVLELFSLLVEQKGITLAYRLPLTEVTQVVGDPQRMRQILVNLVSNAIKFTEQGSVTVNVRWQRPEPQINELLIEVIDTGIGIKSVQLKRLFEPFEQADEGVGKGTGLGLSISRQIARQMGGNITVESESGVGSTFTVRVRLEVSAKMPAPIKHFVLPHLFAWQMPSNLANIANAYTLELGVSLHRVQAYDELPLLTGPKIFLCAADQTNEAEINQVFEVWPEAKMLLLASPRMRLHWEKMFRRNLRILNRPLRPLELVGALEELLNTDDSLGGAPEAYASRKSETKVTATAPLAETQMTESQHVDSKPIPLRETQMHALVVDDNEVNRVISKRMLERMNIAVETCNDGSIAVQCCNRQHFDIVFMDCQMPIMDGYLATEQIRRDEREQQRSGAIIVAMTANAMDGDKQRCFSAGMNDYLAKPIRMEDLAAVLRKFKLLAAVQPVSES